MTETVQQTEPTTETAQGAASAPDEPEDGASTDEQRTFSIGKKSFTIPVKYSELEKDGWKLDLMADETALDGERVWILMANGKNEVETSSVEAYEKGKSLSKYSIGSVEFAEDSGVKPYGWPGVKIGMKVSEAGKKLDAAGFEKTKDEFGTYWECWTDDALIEWSSEDGKTITGYGLSMY